MSSVSQWAAEMAALSGKGSNSSGKTLKAKEKSPSKSVKKVTELPPRWRDSDEIVRLRFILLVLQGRGAKRLHLNLPPEVEEEVRSHGIQPFRRRLVTIFKRTLGFVPGFVIALDIHKGRLHLHGAIEITDNTEPAIKQALRQAAGRWEGSVGNRRQLVLNELDRPDWCATYMTKAHHHSAFETIPRPLWTVTNDIRREAISMHDQLRFDYL